jgi:hypothetical protein
VTDERPPSEAAASSHLHLLGPTRAPNRIRQSSPFGGHFALNGTRFLICCRGHQLQTMLGVTRVVPELVILRHCHDRLPDDSIQAENLSRIVAVSLSKREHSQVPPTRGVIPLFHRRFRVSCLIQIPKAIWLSNGCRALLGPQAPQRPCGMRACVKDPSQWPVMGFLGGRAK